MLVFLRPGFNSLFFFNGPPPGSRHVSMAVPHAKNMIVECEIANYKNQCSFVYYICSALKVSVDLLVIFAQKWL